MENTGFKVSSVFFILYIYRMKKIMKEKNQVVPNEVLRKEFLSQFKTEADVSKFLKQLHAQVLEKMLEGEMDAHLGYEKNSEAGNNTGNSRNGSYPKKIQTEHGESVISIPCDRNGQFEPIAVPKHESHGLSIEKLVISLYAKGMSVSDIEEEMREIYEIELSTSAISIITNKVNQAAQEWQNRPLDPVCLIVWMDGIVFKVRDNGKIINKTVYLCVGLKQNGLKEVLGMWVGKSESSSFWMGVLTDLKARGVQDILITCTDNLNGFTDTIRSVFPQSSTQVCVVHQIRNSCKYVVYKDKKEFTADMKNIYNAPNKEVAATELDNLEKKLNEAAKVLKATPDNLAEKIAHLTAENKALHSEVESLKSKLAQDAMGDVMDQVQEIKGVKLLAAEVDGVDMNGLRDLGDQLKEKLGEGVVVLASGNDGKVSLMVTATDAAMKQGAHAR